MNNNGVFTYRDLKAFLDSMSDAQLDQEVQTLPPSTSDEPVHLLPIYGIETVETYCHIDGEVVTETRSAVDFKHHPEEVVLLQDDSPFDNEGNAFFMLKEDGKFHGNKTGKEWPNPFGEDAQ